MDGRTGRVGESKSRRVGKSGSRRVRELERWRVEESGSLRFGESEGREGVEMVGNGRPSQRRPSLFRGRFKKERDSCVGRNL